MHICFGLFSNTKRSPLINPIPHVPSPVPSHMHQEVLEQLDLNITKFTGLMTDFTILLLGEETPGAFAGWGGGVLEEGRFCSSVADHRKSSSVFPEASLQFDFLVYVF